MSEPLSLGWSFIVALILIAIHALCAAGLSSIAHARNNRLEGRADHFYVNRELYAAACRICKVLVVIGVGLLSYWTAVRHISPLLELIGAIPSIVLTAVSFSIAYGINISLLLVVGELIPTRVAERNPEAALVVLARPLRLMLMPLLPAVRLLMRIANLLLPLLGIEPANGQMDAHTEADLRTLMKESHQSGYIDQTELTLFDNIFEFTETTAREIMIPRTEMICLKAGLSLKANVTIAIMHMRTRYPVCEHDKDNIIGFVHIKDLLKESAESTRPIKSLTRPVTTVPESIPISVLLKLMQRSASQIAILIDEFGGTSGLVTLEDIMEEIVGDIRDEFDSDISDIVKREDGSYSVSGLLLIEEVNGFFSLSISTDNYETIGGWLYAQIDSPPIISQTIVVQGKYVFEIEETRHLRISRITIRYEGEGRMAAE
ncbi:hemolysin family protein [Paenibacillus sp. strain BS8-2]